jgi:hypothetical protein
MYPVRFHPNTTSLHPKSWSVCLQVRPTIVSRLKSISVTQRYIHRCETAEFAKPARTLSSVISKLHAARDLLFCASWPVEQSRAGKRSTFRTPSVLNRRVKEVLDAAFNCLWEGTMMKFGEPRSTVVCSQLFRFGFALITFVVLQWCI